MRLKIKKINKSTEGFIICGLISNDDFIRKVYTVCNPMHFKNDSAKIIAKLCVDYYLESGDKKEAPKKDIHDLININKEDFEDEASIVLSYLNHILKDYAKEKFNINYFVDKTFNYMQLQALEDLSEKLRIAVKRKDLIGARRLTTQNIKEIYKKTEETVSLRDKDFGHCIFNLKKERMDFFVGDLKRYMSPIERGKVIAMLGPGKRGKSSWLLEWAFQGLLSYHNVIFFSLEMEKEEVETRFIQRITGMEYDPGWDSKKKKEYIMPLLDCKHNQDGSCKRRECTSIGTCVVDGLGQTMEYDPKIKHTVCIACQGTKRFKPTTWNTIVKKPILTKKYLDNHLKYFKSAINKADLKIVSFPIGTANISDLEAVLDDLEAYKNWVPDVIVVDYVGILKEDPKLGEKRHRIGENWRELSRMTKVRNCLTISAAQGNRISSRKDKITEEDIGEDYSIFQTVDALIAINEVVEKSNEIENDAYWQRQRIDIIDRRYASKRPGIQCLTLNHFATNQICLDSAIIN